MVGGGVGEVVVVDLEKKERKTRIVIYNPCQSPPFLATLFFSVFYDFFDSYLLLQKISFGIVN